MRDRPDLVAFLHLLDGVHDLPGLRRAVRRRSLDVGDVDALVLELLARGAAIDPAVAPDPAAPIAVSVLAVDPHAQELARAIGTVCGERGRRRVDGDTLVVAVCAAEPSRDAVDDLVDRAGAVLVVRLAQDTVLVGPLVVATRSPCLRCADLGRADADPTWPHVLAQLERHAGPAVAPRAHRLVTWQSALLVAHDAELWLGGVRPSSLGAVSVVGPLPGERSRSTVPFHPRCLCSLFPAGS
ncbi:hypothetical protein ASD11_10315 [Aeromicrobium sp. Root495]|nr:hypothetical protein ASD11_10315 [Aeromicrobium sp. Root495]